MKYKTTLVSFGNSARVSKYTPKCIPEHIESSGVGVGDVVSIPVDVTPKNEQFTKRVRNFEGVFQVNLRIVRKTHIIENEGDEETRGSILGGFLHLQPETTNEEQLLTKS